MLHCVSHYFPSFVCLHTGQATDAAPDSFGTEGATLTSGILVMGTGAVDTDSLACRITMPDGTSKTYRATDSSTAATVTFWGETIVQCNIPPSDKTGTGYVQVGNNDQQFSSRVSFAYEEEDVTYALYLSTEPSYTTYNTKPLEIQPVVALMTNSSGLEAVPLAGVTVYASVEPTSTISDYTAVTDTNGVATFTGLTYVLHYWFLHRNLMPTPCFLSSLPTVCLESMMLTTPSSLLVEMPATSRPPAP